MTNNPWLIISGILLLAAGTYLMRASGALLRGRVVLSEKNGCRTIPRAAPADL